jgi:hypothetical protein
MIRSRNPRIDVDELERRIDAELARDPDAPDGDERLARLAATVHARAIEAQLTFAEQRSTPRDSWPVDLRIPFVSSSERLKKAVLSMMSLAFRDQYEANNALIRSQREMLALVQTLLERIDSLEARLEAERATTRAQRIASRETHAAPNTPTVAANTPAVVSPSAPPVIPSSVEGQP